MYINPVYAIGDFVAHRASHYGGVRYRVTAIIIQEGGLYAYLTENTLHTGEVVYNQFPELSVIDYNLKMAIEETKLANAKAASAEKHLGLVNEKGNSSFPGMPIETVSYDEAVNIPKIAEMIANSYLDVNEGVLDYGIEIDRIESDFIDESAANYGLGRDITGTPFAAMPAMVLSPSVPK
jgi:hypothetical protein